MATYCILLLVLALIWILSFRASKYELLAPISLNGLMFCFATLLAIVGLSSWNTVTELSWLVVGIVALGCMAFSIGGVAADHLNARRVSRRVGERGHRETCGGSDVAFWKYLVLYALLIVAIVLRVAETYRIAAEGNQDLSNYVTIAKWVRANYSGTFSTTGVQIGKGFSLFERGFEKIAITSGFVCVFLAVQKIRHREKPDGMISVLFPVIAVFLSCVFILSTGSRGTVINFVVEALLIWFILDVRDGKSPILLARRFLIAGAILFVVSTVALFIMGPLVGRPAGMGIVDYISFYLGCGVPSLQMALDKGLWAGSPLGYHTFYGIYSLLYKIGITSSLTPYAGDFMRLGGHGSNVYTCFFRYYSDFGLPGVLVLGGLGGFLFTTLYDLAKKSSPIMLVIYAYIGLYLVDLSREDYLSSRLLSSYGLLSLALLVVLAMWMTMSWHDFLHILGRDRESLECPQHSTE
ncbi:MAG: oligosaccharide repeat unit polymerase [Atopobiaceae bacterium]|jgi:oligosaccharide repeat unit polymerase|nr:oligosaccharide repeat unit polymerase [Atopobiaceae bacterium]